MKKTNILNIQFPTSIRGFTLIEILITMAIFVALLAMTGFVGIDTYQRSQTHAQLDELVANLQQARSQAINNIDGMPHGIHFGQNSYTVFEGQSWALHDSAYDARFFVNGSLKLAGPADIIFQSLSAITQDATISLVAAPNRINIITINYEGQINQ